MALDNVHLRKLAELCASHNYGLLVLLGFVLFFFSFSFEMLLGNSRAVNQAAQSPQGGSWDPASHWDLPQEHRVLSAVPAPGMEPELLPQSLGVLGCQCVPWCCSAPSGPTRSAGSRRGLSEMQTDWIRLVMRQALN